MVLNYERSFKIATLQSHFNGKSALITGACGGLGSALAKGLASVGCHLALVDINEEKLKAIALELQPYPVEVSTHTCNIGDIAAVKALEGEVSVKHAKLDLLINNAGITLQRSAANHSEADWQRVFNVNWWGTVNCCSVFLPLLRNSTSGQIINLSSMAAYYGLPSQASYSSSKAAVLAYSEAIRAELAPDGISVTTIHPGAINTDMMTATLQESDNMEQAQKNYALAKRWGVEADVVANKILHAARKKRNQLRIGIDAHILYYTALVMPNLLGSLLAKFFEKSK